MYAECSWWCWVRLRLPSSSSSVQASNWSYGRDATQSTKLTLNHPASQLNSTSLQFVSFRDKYNTKPTNKHIHFQLSDTLVYTPKFTQEVFFCFFFLLHIFPFDIFLEFFKPEAAFTICNLHYSIWKLILKYFGFLWRKSLSRTYHLNRFFFLL